jgi:very-short-patch-repair endonuclease
VNARVAGLEVDFLFAAEGLVVETDGYRHHRTREAFERDRARDARLTVAGYRVVRFTYRQLVREPAAVAAVLVRLLRPAYAASSSSSRPD